MIAYRREGPRIGVEAMCWELVDGRETSGLAIDLSSSGLCIERPYTGGQTRREVPLQLEIPGIDEVMWARGDVCFDVVVPVRSCRGGPLGLKPGGTPASPVGGAAAHGLLRRTGYRIVVAAQRDLRLIKDFVVETHRARREAVIDYAVASCYARA